MKNRSVPVDTVLPHLTYRDVAGALIWLSETFGFVEHYRYGSGDGRVDGAQIHLGDAWVMLNSPRDGRTSPSEIGHHTQSLTIFVADVAAHFARTKSAGAKIVEDLHETAYGERQYVAVDPEGHWWLFSEHVRDVSPDEWGATLAASQ
jgi:uncharacterized glyoxalase superfamily protein PhnB